jgi:hypothetical protein
VGIIMHGEDGEVISGTRSLHFKVSGRIGLDGHQRLRLTGQWSYQGGQSPLHQRARGSPSPTAQAREGPGAALLGRTRSVFFCSKFAFTEKIPRVWALFSKDLEAWVMQP